MDLNLRPADYESAALPTELSWPNFATVRYFNVLVKQFHG